MFRDYHINLGNTINFKWQSLGWGGGGWDGEKFNISGKEGEPYMKISKPYCMTLKTVAR